MEPRYAQGWKWMVQSKQESSYKKRTKTKDNSRRREVLVFPIDQLLYRVYGGNEEPENEGEDANGLHLRAFTKEHKRANKPGVKRQTGG